MSRNHRPERSESEIRVLIVEDSPADAELMLHSLGQAGLQTASRVVQDEPGFRAALADFRPDVILADNHLPRFSGRRALRIARRHDPLLPVIMVTGTLREDRIVRLMSLGLANYVLKDGMLRLGPAVMHALGHADGQRRAVRDHEALEASERRFRAVAQASGDALLIANKDGRIVFWNAAAERMFGYTAEQILDTELTRLVPERYRERHARGWGGKVDGNTLSTPFTAEGDGLRADGTEFPVELTVSTWEDNGHWFLSAQLRDITLRKEETRTRLVLSQVVEQTANSVIITDVEARIQYVNPAFERLTGYAAHEVLGQNPRILKSGKHPPAVYQQMWGELTAGRTVQGEITNRKKDGTEYQQRATIFPIVGEGGRVERYVGIAQDVTQERMLESQLRQAQKMEAVGQLAGGIAHDFNNILTGVLTNAQLLELTLPEDASEERESLQDILTAARRGADLVKRLMSLVRTDAGTSRRVDVRAVVDEAARTVRRILPESIEITVEHPAGEIPCVLDDGELQQALFNLATNAKDAMPDGGLLSIRTLVADGRAIVEVRDNGVGMEPAVAERIFEPFFTTKEVGKGTGLGLAMVYGFVRRVGGTVAVESRPGVGTLLRLALPLAAAAGAEEATSGGAAEAAAIPGGGQARGTVLLAEDQDDIRRVAQKGLERLGYRVLAVADGVDAMAILCRERGHLDLVVSDLVMPRGGGGMLYRNTRDWPDQPRFLFMSGYGGSELNGDQKLPKTVPFLAKPWSVSDLEAAVARVMEGSPS